MMKLSVLDQSPIIAGHSAADPLLETLNLSLRSSELGCHRYLPPPHHASPRDPLQRF